MPKPKKEPPIIEINSTAPSTNPLFCNTYSVSAQEHVAVIDFGFVYRSYVPPHQLEDKQIITICMPWDDVKQLTNTLRQSLLENNKSIAANSHKTNK